MMQENKKVSFDRLLKEATYQYVCDEERKGHKYYGGSDGLINVIYTGSCNDIIASEIAEEDRLRR